MSSGAHKLASKNRRPSRISKIFIPNLEAGRHYS